MRKLFYFSNLLTLCLILSSVSSQAQTITASPTNQTVCSGSIAKFTVAASDTPSFIWQKSADDIVWDTLSNGGAYTGVNTDTLSVAGSAAVNGMKYRAIAYKATGSSNSASAVLTVNALPDAGTITGSSNVCLTGTTSLANSLGGGSWSSANSAIATISATGVVSPVAAGTDSILYTVTNGCGTAQSSFILTIDGTIVHSALTGPTTLCIASFINLTSGHVGGVWTASNANATVSSTGMVSGVTAGLDTITNTYTNTCGTDVASMVVTVESPITAGTISGPTVVCAGSLAPFTATVPGGVWLSNDASVATVDLTGMVTGRGQGIAIISYLFSNACGSFSAMDTLQVDRTASMITGSDSVGVAGNTTLADSVMGGVWTSNDASIATVNAVTGVVTGVATGATNIVYTVTNSCGVSSNFIVMNVGVPGAAGVLTGSDSVCVGSDITITSTVANGVWTVTNPSASVSATGVVTGLIGGMRDTVVYTVTDGFGSTTVKKAIYVNQPPVIHVGFPASYTLGTAYTLIDTPSTGTWMSTVDSIATFISGHTFILTRKGLVDLIYTATNTCGTTRDTFSVGINNVGVNEIASNNSIVTIFPNPNNGAFTMNIESNVNEMVNVVVTNMVGEVVKEIKVPTNTPSNVTLSQPAGVYMVSASTGNGRYTARVVVAK